MRTFVGDDEFVQPKRNETAPRSECRPTFKNALTQPRLLEMAEWPYRSAEGRNEARRAKCLILLPLFLQLFFFSEFSPKIACQVPKPPKSNKQKRIELAC
jgi:hypothetical protein